MLQVWDVEGSQEAPINILGVSGSCFAVDALAVAPSIGRLISGDRNGHVRVWDVEAGVCERTLKGENGHQLGVRSLATRALGGPVYSGGSDELIKVRCK